MRDVITLLWRLSLAGHIPRLIPGRWVSTSFIVSLSMERIWRKYLFRLPCNDRACLLVAITGVIILEPFHSCQVTATHLKIWYSTTCIFNNENFWISIWSLLKLVSEGLIDNKPALVQVMAWRQKGDKPLPEPMLTQLTDAHMQH